jgi:hypothetical protein
LFPGAFVVIDLVVLCVRCRQKSKNRNRWPPARALDKRRCHAGPSLDLLPGPLQAACQSAISQKSLSNQLVIMVTKIYSIGILLIGDAIRQVMCGIIVRRTK